MRSVIVQGLSGINRVFKYDKFQNVRNFLDALPNINCGGCGISTYAMYLWLKKENQLPKDFKVVFLHHYYSKTDFLSNKRVLEEGEGKISAPEHVAVNYKGQVLDSQGRISKGRFDYLLEIPLDKAEDYLVGSLNTDDWNSMFDRPMFTAIIEKELGITFRADLRRNNKSWEVVK